MPIIISKNGDNAKRIEKISFKKEEDLLKYISDNPDCIPIEDIKEDVQFVIGRNLGLQKNRDLPVKNSHDCNFISTDKLMLGLMIE